ncbi:GolD/DthD family dehydrogenase [Scandinavium sp. NPDC088450]|uniref:GolD/DthD family dehydrogenase n=1 Tax=Scandinavium sp. NPDC088450 TaxID=3364514 RepID=UPI00384FF1C6
MNMNEFFGINGKVVMVTGASAGIGLAITELMREFGATVVMVDKNPQVVEQAKAMAGETFGISADLADIDAIPSLVKQVVDRFGRIDVLVNNAGIGILEAASEVKKESWDATLLVNLTAPYFLAQAAGHYMIAQGSGRIISIASQASVIALENHAAYCTSKAGLVIASKVMAAEWGKHGITVNTISPTVVETELGKRYWQGERATDMKAKIPAGRFAMPDEIAAAVAYLASDKAAMITGENLVIDGGYTIV